MRSPTGRTLGSIAVVIILAIIIAFLLNPTSGGGKETTGASTSAGDSVTVLSNNLTVGFQAGLWGLSIRNTGSVGVTEITAVLSTPTQTEMCTGLHGGIGFTNCPSVAVSPFSPGSVITGFASGAGPGSAVPGVSYTMTLVLSFEDGTSTNVTSSVVARSS